MLLTADVGNTNIKFGIYDGESLKFKLRVSTDTAKTGDEFAFELFTFFKIYGINEKEINSSIISSVVPKITLPLSQAIKTVTGVQSLVVGSGIDCGLTIKIDNPEKLGSDIVTGCVGALQKYGGPFIMIFMGTATVIAYVDEDNVYRGGAIAPGVGISLDALTSKGALLPAVDFQAPQRVISTNTSDCMRSGIMFGTASMLDGMIDRFCEQTGKSCKIIATGGFASAMTGLCRHSIIFDENIILDGLKHIYEINGCARGVD